MSLSRYPTYKDSGVEWLGEVPQHWEVTRLKAMLTKRHMGTSPL
jgi:type I restriction enzyme S subunit